MAQAEAERPRVSMNRGYAGSSSEATTRLELATLSLGNPGLKQRNA
jgi:hypothetical protein